MPVHVNLDEDTEFKSLTPVFDSEGDADVTSFSSREIANKIRNRTSTKMI